MKVITFTKELIPLIQSGQKTQTRRLIRYRAHPQMKQGIVEFRPVESYKMGDICIIKNNRFKTETFGYIKILLVTKEAVGRISESDAKAEGFESASEFLQAFMEINVGRIDDARFPGQSVYEMEVWKIAFEYLTYREIVAMALESAPKYNGEGLNK